MHNQKELSIMHPFRGLRSQKGFALSVDLLIAVFLTMSFMGAAFVTQFPAQPVTDSTYLKQVTRDTVISLDESGFVVSLFDRNDLADDAKMDALSTQLNALLPPNTRFYVEIAKYDYNTDRCHETGLFSDCFGSAYVYPPRGLARPNTVSLGHDRIMFFRRGGTLVCAVDPNLLSFGPVPSVRGTKAPWDAQRTEAAFFSPVPKTQRQAAYFSDAPRLELAGSADANLVLGASITPSGTVSCDQDVRVDLNASVVSTGRSPISVFLVMDRSGSMSQLDMNYVSAKGTFAAGLCAAQVQDISGNDQNANNYFVERAPVPDPTGGIAGRFGHDYNRFLLVPDDASATGPNVDVFTLSAWVYPTQLNLCGGNGGCTVLEKENEYWLGLSNSGRLWVAIASTTPGWTWRDANLNVSLNTWTHIALTYDGNRFKSYKNGTLAGSWAGTGMIPDSTNPLRIGVRIPSAWSAFDGYLDRVKMHDAALSAVQVASLYSNTEPAPGNLRLGFDFESLAGNQDVNCFTATAVAPIPTTTCAGLGSTTLYASTGGIPPNYVDFNTVAQFVVSPAQLGAPWMPSASSQLRVLLDRGSPSGVCSQLIGNANDKPPFVRVKNSATGAYLGYMQAGLAAQARATLSAGTYGIEVWNSDSNTYASADFNVYRYVLSNWVPLNGFVNPTPIAATTYLREASDLTPIASGASVPGQLFEEGQCTASGSWGAPVVTYALSDSNVYHLDFRVKYVNGDGPCGPQVRVVGPSGGIDVNAQCPNGASTCTIVPWNTVRTSGSYAPTGNYQVYLKSDATMDVDVNVYHERFFFGANTDSNPMRRCAYTDGSAWVKLGDYSFPSDFNVFLLQFYSQYTYSFNSCLPQLRVVNPLGGEYALNCGVGTNVQCVLTAQNQPYRGPYAPNGMYQLYMRSAQAISATVAQVNFYHLLGADRRIQNPPSANFVGGGHCRNAVTGVTEDCSFGSTLGQPARTNCPNEDVAFSNAATLSLARDAQTLSSIIDDNATNFRQVRIDVNYSGDANATCRGAIAGFSNPLDGNANYRAVYPFPAKGLASIGGYSVNNAWPPWNNLNTTTPIPTGTYGVLGWAEKPTAYSVNWFVQRLDQAKLASTAFLGQVDWKPEDSTGLVSFGSDVTIDQDLTPDVTAVQDAVAGMQPSGETATGNALQTAVDGLLSAPPSQKFIILLSDGKTNIGSDPLVAAQTARDNNIQIFTIAFGLDANQQELAAIANLTGGKAYLATDGNALADLYSLIAQQIGEIASLYTTQRIYDSNLLVPIPDGVTISDFNSGVFTPGPDKNYIFYHIGDLNNTKKTWTGSYTFAFDCNSNYACSDENRVIPGEGTFLEYVDAAGVKHPLLAWDVNVTVLLRYRDLTLSVLRAVPGSSGGSLLDLNVINAGYLASPATLIEFRVGSLLGPVISSIPVAAFSCGKKADGCADYFRVLLNQQSATGTVFALINPDRNVRECPANNAVRVDCQTQANLFYTVDLWIWKK